MSRFFVWFVKANENYVAKNCTPLITSGMSHEWWMWPAPYLHISKERVGRALRKWLGCLAINKGTSCVLEQNILVSFDMWRWQQNASVSSTKNSRTPNFQASKKLTMLIVPYIYRLAHNGLQLTMGKCSSIPVLEGELLASNCITYLRVLLNAKRSLREWFRRCTTWPKLCSYRVISHCIISNPEPHGKKHVEWIWRPSNFWCSAVHKSVQVWEL